MMRGVEVILGTKTRRVRASLADGADMLRALDKCARLSTIDISDIESIRFRIDPRVHILDTRIAHALAEGQAMARILCARSVK